MRKLLSLFLILVLILGLLLGCQREEIADIYMNQRHGYSFEIPEIWKEKMDKVEIIEEDEGNLVTFAYPFECDQLDRKGKKLYQDFFTISAMSKEKYEDELNNPPVVSRFLAEKEGQVYLLYTPLDNIILEKATQEEYSQLDLGEKEIIERFNLEDSNQETIYGEKSTDMINPVESTEDKTDKKIDFADYYFEPNISIIEGKLITRMYYGPPNYGENPDTDEELYPFILQLDEPIDVIAQEDDDFNSDKFGITEIQLAPKREQIEELERSKNKAIRIKGTLFEALVGRHFTDVLISVDEILEAEEHISYTFNYNFYGEENFFTFEYPESWKIVEDDASQLDKLPEKSPDFGLKIYMDNEEEDINIISIFEGVSSSLYVHDENLSKEEFLIDGKKKGYIYSNTTLLEEYDTVNKIITYDTDDEDNAWRYIMLSTEKEFYNKNKDKIKRVIKSIEF